MIRFCYCKILWKDFIAAKFLIAGGSHKTEILNIENFQVEEATANLKVSGGSVGLTTSEGSTICGGIFDHYSMNSCHVYNTRRDEWKNTFELQSTRWYHSVIQINANKALLIGGKAGDWNNLNTMEIVTSSGSTLSQTTLPFTFWRGCATKVNLKRYSKDFNN